MVEWNKPNSSSDQQSELPLYNKHCTRHISPAHSVVLTSRVTSLSPTATFSNLPPTQADTHFSTSEKISLFLRQSKKPRDDETIETAEGSPSKWKVASVILFYLVAAIVMVFANKWVLRATAVPLSFLFCQLLLATVLLKLAGLMGFFEIPKLDIKIGQRLLPLISINVIGLVFNTFCLQYVDASFYQIARGLVLPFTVLASYLFLDSRPSPNILSTVLVVCVGFLWGVQSDYLYTSRTGIALGVMSSMTTSVHAIAVKRSLSVTGSAIELSYYNNFVSAIFLLPLIPFTSEIGTFSSLLSQGGRDLNTFLIGALVTGFFGFLISLAGFLSIKITSPVTHMVSSAVRGVLQTILGAVLFGDIISLNRFVGIGVILGGSLAYTAIKDKEARPGRYYLTTRNRPSQPLLPIVSPSKSPNNLIVFKSVC